MPSPTPLWYYTDGFSTFGPFDASAIRQLKDAGVIRSVHTLRREGDDTALPLSAIDEAPALEIAATPTMPPALPVEIGFQLARNGVTSGPFSLSVLKEKLRVGEVFPNDLVWREGMSEWTRIDRVPDLQGGSLAPPLPPSAPPIVQAPDTKNVGVIIAVSLALGVLLVLTTRFWIEHPGFLLLLIVAGCVKAFGKWIFKKF